MYRRKFREVVCEWFFFYSFRDYADLLLVRCICLLFWTSSSSSVFFSVFLKFLTPFLHSNSVSRGLIRQWDRGTKVVLKKWVIFLLVHIILSKSVLCSGISSSQRGIERKKDLYFLWNSWDLDLYLIRIIWLKDLIVLNKSIKIYFLVEHIVVWRRKRLVNLYSFRKFARACHGIYYSPLNGVTKCLVVYPNFGVLWFVIQSYYI